MNQTRMVTSDGLNFLREELYLKVQFTLESLFAIYSFIH